MISKEKMNPVAPDSLKARAPGVEPGGEQRGAPQGSNVQRGSDTLQRDTAGVGERGGVASQQTGWAARQSAQRMRQRAEGESGAGMQQDQHAGAQESATGPAGKRQTDEARPKLSRARELDK
ncbi:hypothetical protein [Pseudoduganella sp. HUAS MS19]